MLRSRLLKFRVVVVLMVAGASSRQTFAQAYFGQEPPGEEPMLFAPGIVPWSGDAGSEYTPCFWPDVVLGLRTNCWSASGRPDS